MDDDIRKMLEDEIKKELKEISHFQPGSEGRAEAIDDLTKLYRLKMDEDKQELELMNFVKDKNKESVINSESDKDRYIKIGLDLANLILPLWFYAVWMKRGFKFEEKGTFGSPTFRSLFTWFKPTRR